MDIKAKIEEMVNQIKTDDALREQFMKDPVKAVEGLTGLDLPDDQIRPLIEGIKAKLTLDSVGGVADKLKGLFGK